jgi:ABC-type Fe3+/spermidine/putrescine transport system ATPase subunit
MGEILPFKRKGAAERHRGHTLCKSNFHKWIVVKDQQFDVQQGRLITVLRCSRCGKTKVEAR